MAPKCRKNEKFYVVYIGRVDKPTIFSSWGHVHPRVTEFNGADHDRFDTLEDARNSIKFKGFTDFDQVLKNVTEDMALPQPRGSYYAVAYGEPTGIFNDWKAAEKAIKGFKSACHQRFDTEREAKDFIEDWTDAYAEIWQRAIKQGLRDGWKPKDFRLDIASILIKMNDNVETDENVLAKLERLDIKEEPVNLMHH